MMMGHENHASARYLAGAAALFLSAAALLVLQDQRHGWPFSRHHGMQPASVEHTGSQETTEWPQESTGTANNASGKNSSAPSDVTAAPTRAAVDIDATRLQAIGVRFEPARLASIAEPVRAVAGVVADESRVSHVHTRVAGWVEQLFINTTGQSVRAGEPLALVFSQELLSSQDEYLSALRAARSGPPSAVVAAARKRLKVLGMTDAQIAQIERNGEAQPLVTVTAPRSGTVLRRGVNVGTAVDPSTEIMTVADLSKVWIIAEVPEAAAAQVALGAPATLRFPASGRPAFRVRVEFVYPTLTERTRTKRVRFAVPNADGRLPPGMYGTAEFEVSPREALTVPRDAVVDTGDAQHVFVRTAASVLEPRTIRAGTRLGERIEVLEGIAAGEQVAAAGVFLIDSESRLRASGSSGHGAHGPPAAPANAKSAPARPDPAASAHADHGP